MKQLHLLSLLGLCALAVSPAPAYGNPCQALLCMSAFVGNGDASPQCVLYKNEYLSHVVYRHVLFGAPLFDPIATLWLRHHYLMQCRGAVNNMMWIERIDAIWGMRPYW